MEIHGLARQRRDEGEAAAERHETHVEKGAGDLHELGVGGGDERAGGAGEELGAGDGTHRRRSLMGGLWRIQK